MDENTNNTVVDESTEKKVMTPEDYKVVMNLIKETDDSYNTLKESVYNSVFNMGYDTKVINDILPYKKEDIPNMSVEDVTKFLSNYHIGDNEITIDDMIKIKEFSVLLLQVQFETEKAKNETYSVLNDYFNYLSSDQVKKSRMERLNSLKEAIESETDSYRRSKMETMIKTMEASLSFSFLQDRFNLYGEDEINNIKDGFFTEKKGSYIVSRYNSKMKKFGFDPTVYQKFFNIEENFLNEKYAPYNNLFLYIFMRMVAYADPYDENDKILVQSLTSAIANLIYHKFDNIESEQYFIHVITEVIDRFTSYEEYFIENNSTYENHPDRVAAQKEHDKNRKDALIKALKKLNVEFNEEELTADDLQKLYDKTTEELILSQIDINKKEDISEDSVDESSEDLNIIEPHNVSEDIE